MNTQRQIKNENNWKELAKRIVEKNNNYNDFQKEVLKLILEDFYQCRKNAIIRNATQARILEAIINNNT